VEIGPLLVGVLIAILTIAALVTGSGSVGWEGLRRDEDPLIYWAIVLVGIASSALLIWKSLRGWA
jgi:hypothetical protein